MQPTPPASGERWSVNMPAVIGVVFVFLVGVVIWVIASSGNDDAAPATTNAPSATADPTVVTAAPPPTTTPGTATSTPTSEATTPPSTASTTPPTSAPTTPPTSAPAPPPTSAPAPATTAPGAADGAIPGDLAVTGRPMQRPPCDGSYITVLASPIGSQATADSVAAVLDQYPGSNYLRTDQTCSSLTPDSAGAPIYVIFYGPFAFDSDACAARADGPDGAYARQLSNDVGPDHGVPCG